MDKIDILQLFQSSEGLSSLEKDGIKQVFDELNAGIAERITEVFRHIIAKGLAKTKLEIASNIGLNRSSASRITPDTLLRPHHFAALHYRYGINLNYLISNTGEIDDGQDSKEPSDIGLKGEITELKEQMKYLLNTVEGLKK